MVEEGLEKGQKGPARGERGPARGEKVGKMGSESIERSGDLYSVEMNGWR